MRRILSLLALSCGLALSLLAAPAQLHFDGKTWWNHVRVLADDGMEGREASSAGLQRPSGRLL